MQGVPAGVKTSGESLSVILLYKDLTSNSFIAILLPEQINSSTAAEVCRIHLLDTKTITGSI